MQGGYADLEKNLQQHGQGHLVDHLHSLKDQALKDEYVKQLQSLDLKLANTLYNDVYKKPAAKADAKFQEMKCFITLDDIRKQDKELNEIGMKAIAHGEVALCIMSGGQGTRLGFNHPKGMYKIGLQSGMTLFQFFSKRLQSLVNLTKRLYPDVKVPSIPWYIMTSDMNNKEIIDFFQEHKYFGYEKQSIVFFPQGGLPAVDFNGKIIIEAEGKISLAPGGNGAIYYQMKRHGVIDDLKSRHVKYLHIGGIDNILLKVADPCCLGYMIKNNFDIVSKFVNKISPDEKVGIHVLNNGAVQVCEYSEMPEATKKQLNEHGELKYRHSFMATYFVTTEFLDRITSDQETLQRFNSKYHIALKKVPYYDSQSKQTVTPTANSGVKSQLFCFDCFDLAKNFGLFQIDRDEQFAPVKNATKEDSPESARLLISKQHKKWLCEHLTIKDEPNSTDKLCEIDIGLTYNGQGLDKVLADYVGKEYELPLYIK